MDLNAFLHPVKEGNLKFAASKRFLDGEGKPVLWEIKSVSTCVDEALRKECTRKEPIPGKYGQYTMETDWDKYLGKLAALCTVYPNLNDVSLQNAYGAMGGDILLKTMLSPGEYAAYLRKVQEFNGFSETMGELIDEVKN